MADLNACPFKKGLYMKVPKGTRIYSAWGGHQKDITAKTVTVEISDVYIPDAHSMLTAEERAEREQKLDALVDDRHNKFNELAVKVHYPARQVSNGRGGHYTYPARDAAEIPEDKQAEWEAIDDSFSERNEAILKEYILLGQSRIDQDEILVSWSNDKVTKVKFVELVEKPESRKKQPKVNLRQQMVMKSRWKFTQDVDIMYGALNPVYNKHIKDWDKANPRPQHQGKAGYNVFQKWNDDREAMRSAAKASIGEFIPTLYRSVKAGEIFTVVNKFHTYFMPFGWDGEKYTNAAVVLFDGDKDAVCLEYSHIKDFIEAESIPTVDVWVLRYKPTGLYYKAPNYDEGGYYHRKSHGVDNQEMVDTFMKGKKWDNLGKAKTSILAMTGYYEDLPGADESIPDWGGGTKTFDMTDDWELVKFDKLGRQEVGPVADFQEWFKRSWELRALTVKYGSSVRTAYKALEKANLLESQKGMVVFTEDDQEKLDYVGYHGDKSAITKEEQEFIDAAIKSTKMKKGTYKKATDHKSVAVSFPNKGAAMMFKLAYEGKLKTTILDLDTLKEVVDN